jgi:hypothetical protein
MAWETPKTDWTAVDAVGPSDLNRIEGNIADLDARVTVVRIGHTYTIPGEVSVPSGDTNYIPPFFVSLATGQTAVLSKIRYRINSGTSVTFKLQKNGGDITGYTALSATTTSTTTDAADVSLADNDMIALVVTAISGTPKNMSVTIFIDHNQ